MHEYQTCYEIFVRSEADQKNPHIKSENTKIIKISKFKNINIEKYKNIKIQKYKYTKIKEKYKN